MSGPHSHTLYSADKYKVSFSSAKFTTAKQEWQVWWGQATLLNRLLSATLLAMLSGCQFITPGGALMANKVVQESAADSLRLKSIDAHTQAEACRLTGLELAKSEKDEHAIAQFEKARKLDPGLKGVAYPLAVLYDRQGKLDLAEREYQRAIKERPHDADVLSDYGYFLYTYRDPLQAESVLKQALKRDSKHQKAQVNLGLVLARQGKYKEAYSSFEAALGPAAAHQNVGMLLAQAGQQQQAIVHLRQAVERDPSLTQAQSVLAEWEQQTPHNTIRPVAGVQGE